MGTPRVRLLPSEVELLIKGLGLIITLIKDTPGLPSVQANEIMGRYQSLLSKLELELEYESVD